MKILYIITQADGGGAQKYVLALAQYFKGEIAAGKEAGALFNKAAKIGIPTYSLSHLRRNINPFWDCLALWEIRQLVKKLKPDIVHLNSSKAGFLGSLACAGIPVKVVFTAHGFRHNEPLPLVSKKLHILAEKVASRFRDYIITVSKADENSALARQIIGKEKISTVYNGISPIDSLPPDEARRSLKLPDDKFIFGTIANFYKTKGLDILIGAASLLDEKSRDRCLFIIFGDGPEFLNLKSKILNLKFQSFFRLLGQVKNAAAYLKALDIFVLPSRKEGFPYVLLEAMQAGLPIIATDVGGNKEALGEAGLLVPPENPAKLAQALEQLINDQNLRQNLSQKALDRSQIFTLEKMLQETKNIYVNL